MAGTVLCWDGIDELGMAGGASKCKAHRVAPRSRFERFVLARNGKAGVVGFGWCRTGLDKRGLAGEYGHRSALSCGDERVWAPLGAAGLAWHVQSSNSWSAVGRQRWASGLGFVPGVARLDRRRLAPQVIVAARL